MASHFNGRWTASPVLGVRNVRQTAEYYRDILGFEFDPEQGFVAGVGEEAGGVYAIVHRSGISIHFQIRRRELSKRKRESLENDVYVYVNDVDGLYTELKARGAKLHGKPCVALYGLRELKVEDQNGYRLVFGSELHDQ